MQYLAIIGLVFLFIYEFYAIWSEKKGDTISEIVWTISKKPLFPFGMGFLMGHFFW